MNSLCRHGMYVPALHHTPSECGLASSGGHSPHNCWCGLAPVTQVLTTGAVKKVFFFLSFSKRRKERETRGEEGKRYQQKFCPDTSCAGAMPKTDYYEVSLCLRHFLSLFLSSMMSYFHQNNAVWIAARKVRPELPSTMFCGRCSAWRRRPLRMRSKRHIASSP